MPSIVWATIVRQLNAAREHINLIGALAHVAEQTLDRVGGSDRAMHRLGKVVKDERLVFLLNQTAHGLGIELPVLGFERSKLGQRTLLAGLCPNTHQFDLDSAFAPVWERR
jgi:hypothetical protein